MNKQVLNMLGLAMRAGKLITGEERTIQDIRKGKVDLVLVAQDASENTRKKVRDKSTYYQTPYDESLTQIEISQAIGRPRMVVGILDKGFSDKIMALLKG